jgi:pyruvate formate lyase activating enzyme
MKIGGLVRFTLIDYPGKVAAVIFTQGCLFRCHYCHNPSLVISSMPTKGFEEEEIFSFLHSRRKKLDGIVITGGEPTLHSDLPEFLEKIKKLGFLVKLDTSGVFPEKLENLLEKKLVDYIAMDIKAPLEKYPSVTGVAIDPKKIQKSIALIKNSSIPYEFRSTLLPFLHTKEDIISMAKLIEGSPLYILQNFVAKNTLNPDFEEKSSFSLEDLESLQKEASFYVKKCLIR